MAWTIRLAFIWGLVPDRSKLLIMQTCHTFQEGKQLRFKGTVNNWAFRSTNRSSSYSVTLRQNHSTGSHVAAAQAYPILHRILLRTQLIPKFSISYDSGPCHSKYTSDQKACQRIIKGRKKLQEASGSPCHFSHAQYPSWVGAHRKIMAFAINLWLHQAVPLSALSAAYIQDPYLFNG